MANDDESPAVLLLLTTERVDPWEVAHGGGRFCYFLGTRRGCEAAAVRLADFQRADGMLYDLAISVNAEEPLDAATAERLIEDLGAALEDLRRLAR